MTKTYVMSTACCPVETISANAQKSSRRRRNRKDKPNANSQSGANKSVNSQRKVGAVPGALDLSRFGIDGQINRQIESSLRMYMSKARLMGVDPQIAFNYAAALLDPGSHESRYPDSFTDKTQLVRMPMEFSIPIGFSSVDPDSGRFSFIVQPHLGSTSTPDQYKVAIVNTADAIPWAEKDFTSPSTYLDLVQGRDPRLDTFFSILTQPSLGCATMNGTNSGNVSPFDFFDYIAPTYGITVQDSLGNSGDIMFGQGIYRLSFIGQDPAGNTWNVVSTGEADIAEKQIKAGGNLTIVTFTLAVRGPLSGVNVTSSVTTWTTAQLNITQTFYTTNTDGSPVVVPLNAGVVNTYRPVAMSILASYVGSSFVDGGNLVAALVPGNTSNQNYFTSNPAKSVGQLQNYENLEAIPGALRTTKLAKGAYVYYTPEKPSDNFLYTPQEAVSHAYPSVVISGTFVPGQTLEDGPQNVLKVIVTTQYEMITTSFLWEQDSLCGSQAIIDLVQSEFQFFPRAMENPQHKNFIKSAFNSVKKALGWGVRNAGKVAKAVETAGEIGAMFL